MPTLPNLGSIALIVIVIGVTLYFAAAQPRVPASEVAIPTKNDFMFVAPKDAPNGTLHIHTTKDVPAGSDMLIDVRNYGLSESPAQKQARAEAGVQADYVRNRVFFDPAPDFPTTDFGTFAAVRTGHKFHGFNNDDGELVVGLRASPVRLLYGTVAPDFLVAPYDLGLGVSFYAPADLWGNRFNHWGVGAGRLWSTAHNGLCSDIVYLSFSTKDF